MSFFTLHCWFSFDGLTSFGFDREEYASLVAELARHSNVVTTYQRETARSDSENKELCDLALKCLQHLGTWNLHVLDMVSYFKGVLPNSPKNLITSILIVLETEIALLFQS